MRPRKMRRNPRGGCLILVVAVVVIAVIASVSGSSGPVTRADAIQNVVNKIDSGPNWETQAMSDSVSGYLKFQETNNGNGGGGGCAYVNGSNAGAGFACYLETSEENGEFPSTSARASLVAPSTRSVAASTTS